MLIPFLIALHVATVVIWIGGVAFVTIIIFPMLLAMEDSLEKVLLFQRVENKFARQARFYAWVVGLTGGILLYLTGEFRLLFTLRGIGITIMLIAWLVYVFILTFEKRLFRVLFSHPERLDSSEVFRRLNIFHWFILGLSLLAIFAGVLAGHGGL